MLARHGAALRRERGPCRSAAAECLPWVLAVAAVLAAIPVAVVAWCTVRPARFDGIGRVGGAALTFPLHLLVPAAGLAGLAVVAAVLEAAWAAAVFAGLAVVVAALALGPAVAVARQAGTAGGAAVAAGVRRGGPAAELRGAGPEPAGGLFATVDGVDLLLDWWPAAGAGPVPGGEPVPAVVKVHGGGWTGGGRNEAAQWNRWLNELGYHVFDVDYRLAPPPRWEDAVADVRRAVAWVAEQAGAVGADPARISLMGHSAGGHLALLAGYTRRRSACSLHRQHLWSLRPGPAVRHRWQPRLPRPVPAVVRRWAAGRAAGPLPRRVSARPRRPVVAPHAHPPRPAGPHHPGRAGDAARRRLDRRRRGP